MLDPELIELNSDKTKAELRLILMSMAQSAKKT